MKTYRTSDIGLAGVLLRQDGVSLHGVGVHPKISTSTVFFFTPVGLAVEEGLRYYNGGLRVDPRNFRNDLKAAKIMARDLVDWETAVQIVNEKEASYVE